jgi:hypothetical protein
MVSGIFHAMPSRRIFQSIDVAEADRGYFALAGFTAPTSKIPGQPVGFEASKAKIDPQQG